MSSKRKPSAKVKKSAGCTTGAQTPKKNVQSKHPSSGSKKEGKKRRANNQVFIQYWHKQPSLDPKAGLYGQVDGDNLKLLYYAEPCFIGDNANKKPLANCMMSLFAHKWAPCNNTIISENILGMVSLKSESNTYDCTEEPLHDHAQLQSFNHSPLKNNQQPLAFSIYANLQPCGTCAGIYNQGVSGENVQHNYLQQWGIKDYLLKRTISTSPVPWHHYCWMITTNEINCSNTSNEKRTWYATHIGNIKKASQPSSDNPGSLTCPDVVNPTHARQNTSDIPTSSHKPSPNDLLENNTEGEINGKVKITTDPNAISDYVPLFYAHLKDHSGVLGALDQLNNKSVKNFLKKYADKPTPACVFSCDGSTPGGSVVYQQTTPSHGYNTRANKRSYPKFFSQDATSSTDINPILYLQERLASGQVAPLSDQEPYEPPIKKIKQQKNNANKKRKKSLDEQLRELEPKTSTPSSFLEAAKRSPQSSDAGTHIISTKHEQQACSAPGFNICTSLALKQTDSESYASLPSQTSSPNKTNNDKPPLTAKNNNSTSYAKIVSS